MEMCYDGTLVMPSSYAVMSEEEMTYVEGGKKITITLAAVGAFLGGIAARKVLSMGATAVGKFLMANAGNIATWFLGTGFFVQAAVFALAGALVACGLAFAITLVAHGSVTIGF